MCVCVCVCLSLSLYVHYPPSSCSNLSHLFCKLEQTSSRPLKSNKPFEHKAHNIPILPLRNNVRGRSASTHSAPTHPSHPRLLPPTKHNCSKERGIKKSTYSICAFQASLEGSGVNCHNQNRRLRSSSSYSFKTFENKTLLSQPIFPPPLPPKNSTNTTFTSQSQKQNCSENHTRWCREQTSRFTKKNTQKQTNTHTHITTTETTPWN
jgi:hypothetical protein